MTEKYSNEQLEMLIQSIIESENPSALAIIAEQGFYHEQLMMSENEHIRAIVAKYTDNVKFLKVLASKSVITIKRIKHFLPALYCIFVFIIKGYFNNV